MTDEACAILLMLKTSYLSTIILIYNHVIYNVHKIVNKEVVLFSYLNAQEIGRAHV